MRGADFSAAIKEAGYTQQRFAEIMGVHRTRIARQSASDTVEPYWVYALAGLVARKNSDEVRVLVEQA